MKRVATLGEQRSAAATGAMGRYALMTSGIGFLILLIALPLTAIFTRAYEGGLPAFWKAISSPEAVFSLRYTLTLATATTVINAVMGTLVAYVLARQEFRGKSLVDSLVDLPIAIPASVTGFTLLLLYGPVGTIGGPLSDVGISIMFSFPGILVAHLFMTFPYVVRAVGPVLQDSERGEEEAAQTLGASALGVFRYVTFPAIQSALIVGSIFTFARSLGEFGATIMVSGNLALRTQTAPLFIFSEFNAGNIEAASAMSVVLVLISFVLFFGLKFATGKLTLGRALQ
ncbi:hypothetical protein LCGC14_2654250 [marine sediment metagenome]|uniref:ABC transmembrane type-1 domain-containing protein n=1 Tax=marine sediment metagenome TaxID=412755 RepID=A0A0F8ZTW7_9ZZZZ